MNMSLSPITNIHHAAYRCRDAEQTRWFYQDVLGLRYRAGLTFDEVSGTDIKREYMHLFFEMGDGSCIAFFDDPQTASEDQFKQRDAFDLHVAFEVDKMEDLEAWKRKIKSARVKCFGPIDHHFVKSIYFYDPNGLALEITCLEKDYEAIMDSEEKGAETVTKEWTERTRKIKEDLFGKKALERREVAEFFSQ